MAALVAAILLPYTLNAQEITICPNKDGKSCAVSFTFDDGFQDNYTIAAPELEKRGWKGTFWLSGSRMPGESDARTFKADYNHECDSICN